MKCTGCGLNMLYPSIVIRSGPGEPFKLCTDCMGQLIDEMDDRVFEVFINMSLGEYMIC